MAKYTGTSAANRYNGTAYADTIYGYGGADILDGRGGNDMINGGSGNDQITGGSGADRLTGGGGNDTFFYGIGGGADVITDFGLGDFVRVSGYTSARSITQVGTSVVVNFATGDQITFLATTVAKVQAGLQFTSGTTTGGGGSTTTGTINGTSSADTLNGTSGNDTIYGLAGNDTIRGNGGADRIYGGLGHDVLYGGAGADVFVYTSLQDSYVISGPSYSDVRNADEIADFDVINDRVDLSAIDANSLIAGNQAFIWGGSGVGHLMTSTFAGTDLVADIDGDGRADLYIYFGSVGETNPLSAMNFIL